MFLGFVGVACYPVAEFLLGVDPLYVTTPSVVLFVVGVWLRTCGREEERGAVERCDRAADQPEPGAAGDAS